MLRCEEGCYPVCDFCLFYDFNGDKDGIYDGHGVCWHPNHPQRRSPADGCNDFICFRVIGGDKKMKIEVEKENLEDILSYISSSLEGVENGEEAGIDRQQIIGTLRDAEGWLFEITQESKISLDNEQHEQFEKSLLERLDMMCRMFGDTYDNALEFKKQRDELLEMLKGVIWDIEMNRQISDDTFDSGKAVIANIEGDTE